ncbi:hypothetical protein CVD28_09545 [Bacillus sp. M6-12]|uniref:aspartyl-phosphate phosphatase Spo0E family protein n=1 Tax=Bacillus sp. M6-12 TaxID=2054166 RepID=UPI000C7576AC|nr:aspartyl-phosphate phosphatase Spo0E family protein [Bacillus sp. M6-12]PLS17922.1 hypothetical protein CVD28_09545 [Bacillus sp. M6-12]
MTIKLLATLIESHRIKMMEAGLKYGLSSPITIKLSQELDELLNLERNLHNLAC